MTALKVGDTVRIPKLGVEGVVQHVFTSFAIGNVTIKTDALDSADEHALIECAASEVELVKTRYKVGDVIPERAELSRIAEFPEGTLLEHDNQWTDPKGRDVLRKQASGNWRYVNRPGEFRLENANHSPLKVIYIPGGGW